MKYPIYHKWAYWSLTWLDGILSLFFKKKQLLSPPKSILICQTAHLGDVILTTSILPPLRALFPHAKIGMLVGSWSQAIVKEHPDLQAMHLVDHWKLSQGKYYRYLKMRRAALKEVIAYKYDLAIDCGLHFPNMAPFLWQAKIPVRAGFSSAGFSPLLTHVTPWDFQENRSVVEAYASLLESLAISIDRIRLKPCLALEKSSPQSYLVIHMGSGNPRKNWPETHWKALVERLVANGYHLKFTGTGEVEHQMIENVTMGLTQTENLCDQLSWKAFTQIIQNGALLVAPDTCAGHVAAAVGTPAILLFSGIHPNEQWKPYGGTTTCLTHPMPCSPCFKGCKEMACLQLLSVDRVYHEIENFRRARSSEV